MNLAYIHLWLEELFGGLGDKYFGSMNMLFVGDILQLPPVTGSLVFSKLCNKLIASRMGSIASVNIWKETIVYDKLTINERQKKDRLFRSMWFESLECLKKRVINVTVVEKYTEFSKAGSSPICLFPTRKACKEFYAQMILDNELQLMKLVHPTSGPKQLEKLNNDSNLTAGLEAELTLAVRACIML